tara:strand:+ start:1017 stop:1208 length:192 start_codon:yes stop_codon:yes gene_type:complete
MSKETENRQNESYSEVSIRLPERIVKRFDELKEKWGLERRGAVLERLLDEIFEDDKENPNGSN